MNRLLALLTLLALWLPLGAGEAPATLLAQPDKLLIEDALTKDAKAAEWKTAKGKWERTADGLRVEEIPADNHGAVHRLATKLQDFVLEFDFRLDGASSIALSINSADHHMARVVCTPTTVRVQKDDHDKEGPDKASAFLNQTQAFTAGTWHHVVLEMVGDTLVATIDGKISGFGRQEYFKTEKANPGFTCSGQSATFRNFTLWSAKPEPKATWKETSGKLIEAMKATPQPAKPTSGKAAAKAKVKTEK